MTMMVLMTSDAEWMASEIMAPEWATIPATSLNAVRTIFSAMLRADTRMAMASFSFS